MHLSVLSDQRFGAIGRTRCGKTFLMEQLLAEQPRVIVIDSKWRVKFKGFSLTHDARAALTEDKIIYRHGAEGVPSWFWEAARDSLVERGGGIIYLDEASVIVSPNKIPDGLGEVFRLGGEQGVAVWWSAQESTSIHNTLLRQSDLLALFFNQGASDRDKLIRTCGDIGEVTAYLPLWQFVVFQGAGTSYRPDSIPVYQVDPH